VAGACIAAAVLTKAQAVFLAPAVAIAVWNAGPVSGAFRRAASAIVAAAAALGCTIEAPFQLLSFLALSVIPSLKITDRGLVDVDRFELVPLRA